MRDIAETVHAGHVRSHTDDVKSIPPQPPLLADIMERLKFISQTIEAQKDRLCGVADRAFGARPESESPPSIVAQDGMADAIFGALDAIDFNLREMRDQGARIERIA